MSNNCPAIRFLGFSNNWEILKFGDNFKLSQGIQIPIEKQYLEHIQGTERFIRIVDITQKEELPRYIHVFTNKGKVNKNDIFFVRYGAIGIIGYGYTGIIANNLFKVTPIFKSNNNFLYQQFSGTSFNKKLKDMSASSSMPAINFTALKNLSVLTTSLEEQNKIATLLSIIDSKINQESSILKKLQILKQAMLEKMFPKENSNIPELRFKGFTNVWEQRKLSDYLEVSNEKNRNNIYDKNDVLSVSGDYGIVNQIEFQGRSFAGASVSNYGIVHTNDIVYTKSPLNANPYGIIKTNKGKPGIVSTLYAIYHPNKNTFSNFVQSYFEQHARMNNYMHPLVNKGAKNDMKVSSENALKGYVIFPKYDEQVAISAFFEELDKLITLHQRKLEKYKQIKQALMDKMFV